MAFYVNDHYQHLQNFYLEEQKNDSNKTIENLVKIFNDTTNNNFFQQENLPLFSFVKEQLKQLGVYINNRMSMKNFDQILIILIQNLNLLLSHFIQYSGLLMKKLLKNLGTIF